MGTDLASPPMPVDLPPVSKVYQDQMTTLSHGLALWNPSPPKEIYDKVSIGDVGYLHEGSFIRMFNVMLPWSHESNRTLGQPEPYQSLDCGPFTNTLKHQFDRVKHCSRYVSAETNAGNRQAMTLDDMEGVTYKFRNCGALLSLPNGGHHEDVIRAQVFEDYIQAHVDSWFTWAQKNRLGVERIEDLILVSGCTLVTSWAAAAFVDDTMDAEISLESRMFNNGRTSFVWSNIRGRVFYHNSRFKPFHGEQNSTMTQDQCIFIRGFRVKDDNMQVIRVPRVLKVQHDDPNIGAVDTIRPFIKNEDPQRPPYRHSTTWRYDSVSYASSMTGSSSSLNTIRHPISRENPQLHPYPSSTALQSNGDICDASFMTSPSDDSAIDVPNDVADHAIIDQDTTANVRATRRQQIKNKILAVRKIQLMFQNRREGPENASDFNVASEGMDNLRSFGTRDGAEIRREDAFAGSSIHPPASATIKMHAFYAVVLYDFVAERPDELDAKAGDSISVSAHSSRKWLVAQAYGRISRLGLIPVSFVEFRDPATGKPIADIAALMDNGTLPHVENWKKQVLGYIANTNRPTAQPPATAQMSSTQPYDEQNLSNRPQAPPILPDGLLLSANVISFHFEMDEYWFRVHALYQPFDPTSSFTLPPAKDFVLFRTYNDFFDYQIELLEKFPRETGREGNNPRIIPFMPGLADEVNDTLSAARRQEELDSYLRRLCYLNRTTARYILYHNSTRKFFALKPGDVERDTEPQYNRMADVGWYIPSEEPVVVCKVRPKALLVKPGQPSLERLIWAEPYIRL